MFRNVVLALFLLAGSAAANRVPTVDFTLGHSKLGSNPSPEELKGEFKVETQLTDHVVCGATLAVGESSDAPVKNVFARVTETVMGRNVKANLKASLADNALSGVVEVGAGANGAPGLEATLSTDTAKHGAMPFLEKVKLSRSGPGWSVTPTVHAKGFEVDLSAATSLGDKTKASVDCKHGAAATVKLVHALDADTAVRASAQSGLEQLEVGFSKSFGKADRFEPTYHADAKQFSVEWRHELGSGSTNQRALTTTVDQRDETVAVELSGDFNAKVSAPWAAPQNLEVTFGKKFSVAALSDLGLNSIRSLKGE